MAVVSHITSPAPEKQRVRLDFLDGLRGLAATYVVLYHVWTRTFSGSDGVDAARIDILPRYFGWTSVLAFGHFAVGIFIVLSGFCLMLPVARSGAETLPGGFGRYIYRRARRILPPYYVALILFGLMEVVLLKRIGGHSQLPTLGGIISHIFMVFNLNPQWINQVDGPMWSVATEWQIYFVFPLLLLPLWRRFGLIAPIIAGLVIGLASLTYPPLRGACFWYIGLFAMGMAGAELSFSPTLSEKIRHWPWAVASLVSALLALAAMTWVALGGDSSSMASLLTKIAADVVVGLATMISLVYCSYYYRFHTKKQEPLLMRLLSSPVAVTLGTFSYSIYLIHFPILMAFARIASRHITGKPLLFAVLLCIGTPLVIGLAYLFHRAFERPFMNMPPEKKTKQASPA